MRSNEKEKEAGGVQRDKEQSDTANPPLVNGHWREIYELHKAIFWPDKYKGIGLLWHSLQSGDAQHKSDD